MNIVLCRGFDINVRKAYEEGYSWEIIERRLVDIYEELTGGLSEIIYYKKQDI